MNCAFTSLHYEIKTHENPVKFFAVVASAIRIHLVSTINIEMQQHLNKINSRILHVKISCRIFDPSLNNKTTVLMMQTTQKDIIFKIIDSLMK